MHRVLSKVLILFRRRRFEAEMAEEMRQHIDELTRASIASGIAPSDARREAERRFGRVSTIKNQCRSEIAFAGLERLLIDGRLAVRFLRRAHLISRVTLMAVVTGICGTTIVVSHAARNLMLSSLPLETYGNPHPKALGPTSLSLQQEVPFMAFEEKTHVSTNYGAVENATLSTVSGGDASAVTVWNVSNDFFDFLGVKPVLGRGFLPEEGRGGTDDVVVITDLFWRKHFKASPDILGHTLVIDQQIYTIVGVLAADQTLPSCFKGDIYRLFVFKFDPKNAVQSRIFYWNGDRAAITRIVSRASGPGFTC